jgi:hypothetical protein
LSSLQRSPSRAAQFDACSRSPCERPIEGDPHHRFVPLIDVAIQSEHYFRDIEVRRSPVFRSCSSGSIAQFFDAPGSALHFSHGTPTVGERPQYAGEFLEPPTWFTE